MSSEMARSRYHAEWRQEKVVEDADNETGASKR